jgi:hypothetical protein
MASGKTKKDECLEACTEATNLDSEAAELTPGSPEQVMLGIIASRSFEFLTFISNYVSLQLEKLRQALEKYEWAVTLLGFVANQELKSLENFKKTYTLKPSFCSLVNF